MNFSRWHLKITYIIYIIFKHRYYIYIHILQIHKNTYFPYIYTIYTSRKEQKLRTLRLNLTPKNENKDPWFLNLVGLPYQISCLLWWG